jgi:cytochrome b subunit of formate dehydrogenase
MWLRLGSIGLLASLAIAAVPNDKGLFVCPKGKLLFVFLLVSTIAILGDIVGWFSVHEEASGSNQGSFRVILKMLKIVHQLYFRDVHILVGAWIEKSTGLAVLGCESTKISIIRCHPQF